VTHCDFFLQYSKNTQWSTKFVPGAMGQIRFRSILSYYTWDKIDSMEQKFIMFHCGPSLWDNFVGQKGGSMTNDQFCWWHHQKDVCYCHFSFSTAII